MRRGIVPTSLFSSLLLMLFCKFLNKTGAWPWLQCCSDCCFLNCIDCAGFYVSSYFQEEDYSVHYAILVFSLLLCLQVILANTTEISAISEPVGCYFNFLLHFYVLFCQRDWDFCPVSDQHCLE